MRSVIMFDLDGVLIDAWDLIAESYRRAGVVAPSRKTLQTIPGRVWIRDRYPHLSDNEINEIHHRKNVRYLHGLQEGQFIELPPLDVAHDIRHDVQIGIITGAPFGTRLALYDRGWAAFDPWYDSIPMLSKYDALRLISTTRPADVSLIYIDDQEMIVPTGWEFIHYRGQSYDELLRDIVVRDKSKGDTS